MKAIRRFTVRVSLPEPLAPLLGLMLNLRWSWHAPTVDLFASIDPDAWQAAGGDPVAMLSALSSDQVSALAADQDFLARLAEAGRGGGRTRPLAPRQGSGFVQSPWLRYRPQAGSCQRGCGIQRVARPGFS